MVSTVPDHVKLYGCSNKVPIFVFFYSQNIYEYTYPKSLPIEYRFLYFSYRVGRQNWDGCHKYGSYKGFMTFTGLY